MLTGRHPYDEFKSQEDPKIDFDLIKNEQARECLKNMLESNEHTRATADQLLASDWVLSQSTGF